MSPLSNAFLREDQLGRMEPFYPLRALVCERCLLVQLEEFETPEAIFAHDYAYFSSYSATWLRHAEAYADMAVERFGLGTGSRVVEVASNDGYLLRWFQARGVPVLGVEPAANVAEAARAAGIPTVTEFFGRETARRLRAEGPADLIAANNVLAHVPDLNDFVAGFAALLAPDGVVTVEFPHLMWLLEDNQFDTIYHEHFSYFSFRTVREVFAAHGLSAWDVEELPTHGGSLRIFAVHAERAEPPTERAEELAAREEAAGLGELDTYLGFSERVHEAKRELLEFLIARKREGQVIVGYGAPAKGNTLLNFCGIGRDFLDYVVDASPHKQGLFLPGTHIPVRAPEAIRETEPDIVLILPWNIRDEIVEQMGYIREWGGRFVEPSPRVRLLA
jgi:SAM-dependent methyltransferase